jgi:hypothetical protein
MSKTDNKLLVYKITLEILRFTSARRAEPHHKSLNTETERSTTIQHGDFIFEF